MTNESTQVPQQPVRRGLATRLAGLATVGAVTFGVGLAMKVTISSPPKDAMATQSSVGSMTTPADDGPAPPALASFTTLKQAMKHGLNPSFGELSVYAFHGVPLEGDAVGEVTTSARSLQRAAHEVPLLAKRNFTADEREFFRGLASTLVTDADALVAAAEAGSSAELTRIMTKIDTTCQSCHARLAPHLSQER